jgi:hypothetical protein
MNGLLLKWHCREVISCACRFSPSICLQSPDRFCARHDWARTLETASMSILALCPPVKRVPVEI